MPFKGKNPKLHDSVFVAPGAHIIGDVSAGAHSSVWFTAVLRGDINKIRVGRGTNIQDGALLHVDHDKACTVGDDVTIGHQASVHACRIGNGTLIGIGARVLSGAKIGEYCLIGAGAVVRENAVIPPHSLVVGVPGKVIRTMDAEEAKGQIRHAKRYAGLASEYKKYLG